MFITSFTTDNESQSLEAKLIINYRSHLTEEDCVKALPFTCGEDLHNYMAAIFKRNYKLIFDSSEAHIANSITDMWVQGVIIEAEDDKLRFDLQLTDEHTTAKVSLKV